MPDVSRRTVMVSALSGLGVAAVAVATPAVPAFAGGASRAGAAVAEVDPAAQAGVELTRSLFQPAVGRRFLATSDERSIHLVLTAIDDIPGGPAGDDHRFSLNFSAGGHAAVDGLYTLTCDDVATTTLFIATVGPRALTTSMQAIVNRNA